MRRVDSHGALLPGYGNKIKLGQRLFDARVVGIELQGASAYLQNIAQRIIPLHTCVIGMNL